jgi:DNA-binding NarL/FixJ family response regulator
MKILLAEKSKNLISALMLLLNHIKNTDVKNISLIQNVDRVESLHKKLKKEKPDVLIINGGFADHQTSDDITVFQKLYPLMTTLVLSTDIGLQKKYLETGMDNFILKGDSAEDFYISIVKFLHKEEKKFLDRSF